MAGPFQVVLIFKGPSGYGWSERFWLNPTIDPGSIGVEVGKLVQGRAAILTSSCSIVRARIQQSTKRVPFIIALNFGAGQPGTESPPTAESEVALLCLFQATNIGFMRPFCRGIPARIVSGDNYMPDDPFKTNLGSFFTTIFDGQWFVNGFVGSNPTPFPISSLEPNMPRGFTATFAANVPAGITQGTVIRVHRATQPGYNGLKTVVNVTPAAGANPGSILLGGAAPSAGEAVSNAFLTIQTATSAPIQTAEPLGISRRGAGRPFGLIRGRRPTLFSLRR